MLFKCAIASIGALVTIPVHAEFYKCSDSAGKITYSDQPCQGKDSGDRIVIKQSSKFGMSSYRPDPVEQALQLPSGRQLQDSPSTPSGSSSACTDARRSYENEAGSLRKDSAAIQAKRSSMYVACGVQEPPPAERSARTRNSMPAPQVPSAITNCDAGGCWDNVGGRYNSGGGNIYWGPGGKACQMIAGQMQCP